MRFAPLVLLVVLAVLAGCSRSEPTPPAPKTASGAAITSEEQVCDLLTNDEVTAEIHAPVTGRRLPQAGEYGAPSCGWQTSEDPKAPGISVVLFFHPEAPDMTKSFHGKLDSVCKSERKDISGLGDEAALCRALWVLKGKTYFSVGPMSPDPAIDWSAADERLARHVLERLP